MAKKRKDECLFCGSRKCSNRIVSIYDNGATYDEVSCREHERELSINSDKVDVPILFIISSGRLKRGESFSTSYGEKVMVVVADDLE